MEQLTVTNTCCDRCRAAISEGHTVIMVKVGSWSRCKTGLLDLCRDCDDLFDCWLRSARQTTAFAPGGAIAPLDAPMPTMTR
jgi:hypothetical protein